MFVYNFVIFSFFACSFAFYENSSNVKQLDESNFEEEVLNGKGIWFIQFFSRDIDDCYEYSEIYEKVGKALNGFIEVGAVDVDQARLLAYRYNIVKLPTIIFINQDKSFTKHKGGKNETDFVDIALKLISEHMHENLKDKYINLPFVKELTKSDVDKQVKIFGQWIIAYYNSSDFTDDNFKTSFTTLANKLQDNIKFGCVDLEKTGEIDDIHSGPAIVYYFGKKSSRKVLKYDGAIDEIDKILSWALSNIKVPEVMELRDENFLRDSCVKKKYCAITVISNSRGCDKECKNNIKDILSSLAEKYKYYSVAWALVRKNTMPILEETFNIATETKLPIMLIVNVQTLKSKELADFDAAKAEQFLENIFHGSGFTNDRLPGFDDLLNEHYAPWHDEL